jgi:DUF1680 family protein
MEGNRYFYVNPLEVWSDNCIEHSSRSHIKPVRQKWFDVACCPTNVARTFTSLAQYIYFIDDEGIYINLFIQNYTVFNIREERVSFALETDYPRSGNIKFKVKTRKTPFSIMIRIPGFAEDFRVSINGAAAEGERLKGYYCIRRVWEQDEADISFTLHPRIVYANPLVRANCGKIAITRGPEIYCLEEADNGAGLATLYLDPATELREVWREDLLGGTILIACRGKKLVSPGLVPSFSYTMPPQLEDADLIAIPYGSWCNRKPGEMLVWIHAILRQP